MILESLYFYQPLSVPFLVGTSCFSKIMAHGIKDTWRVALTWENSLTSVFRAAN